MFSQSVCENNRGLIIIEFVKRKKYMAFIFICISIVVFGRGMLRFIRVKMKSDKESEFHAVQTIMIGSLWFLSGWILTLF